MILVAFNGNTGADYGTQHLNFSELKGILLMLGGLVAGAFASVVVARSPDKLDPFVLNAGQLITGSMGLLLVAYIRGDQFYNGIPSAGFWFSLLWLVIVTSGGFSLWYYLLKIRKEALSEMAVWKFLIPLGGAVLSWIFIQDDNPDLLSFAGMCLTALSIFLFYRTSASLKSDVLIKGET